MAILKCKMCGGDLEVLDGVTVCECEYCGTKQTVPTTQDEVITNLYNRANNLRIRSEFDKAQETYEKIVSKNPDEAEAYWGIVLCKYGIEYVEDPDTFKRVPTCHRTQLESVMTDVDYLSAIEHADSIQKDIYEQEAKAIDLLQKDILSIVHKEKPFDVFICYKETDENGKRTVDSVVANDIYHQLTQEGFKVFYAAITLEDKLGQEYEPYIFAALNSAKVMLVVGTKPEHFNAVWVKNEWSRYLKLMKNDRKRTLIPCYRDMDAYDLPEEFSHLQAQDMSKIGFINDVVRGIKKLIAPAKEQPSNTVVVESNNNDIAPILKRAFIFLEDGNWKDADEYCERVLDLDPENAQAYLGKLMAELKVHKQDDLAKLETSFDESDNYIKASRYANEKLCGKLNSYLETIRYNADERMYQISVDLMATAKTEEDFINLAESFESLENFKDSKELAAKCRDKAEEARKDAILSEGKSKMTGVIISNYESAIKLFESISGWKDADEQIIACQRKIEEIKDKAEIARKEEERIAKRNKKIAIITTPIVCTIIAFIILLNTVIIPNGKYNNAIALMDAGKYTEAISAFEALDGYKDSTTKITECHTAILDGKYNDAIALMDAGNIVEAYETLVALNGYKDSSDKASSIYYEYKVEKLKVAKAGDYVFFGAYEQDNNTSNGKEYVEWLVLEVKDGKALVISKYALDCKPYETSHTDVTWETCTLREWLNNDFINAAFSADEKAMIPTVTVSADKNPKYSTDPGNATQDQVFLLSITEANKYFSSDSARQCEPTDYAVANGARESDDNGICLWWLRSPGDPQNFAAFVSYKGDVAEIGNGVDNDYNAVRPALWISVEM